MPGAFRFLLAVMVVLGHLVHTPYYSHLGYYAVRAFFVLSGFVMTAALTEVYGFDGKRFSVNRFLRLAPPYLTVRFRARHSLPPGRCHEIHAAMGISGGGGRCRGRPHDSAARVRQSAISLHRTGMVACGRDHHVCLALAWYGTQRPRRLPLPRDRRGLPLLQIMVRSNVCGEAFSNGSG